MLQPDRYSFIPPLQKRHIPFVVAWIVVIVIIALISSRGASARSIGWAVITQTPHPTYTPWYTATPSNGSRAASAGSAPIVFSSPLQSPLALPTPTPTPQPLIVSFSPGPGQRDVDRHTPLRITFRLDLDHRVMERGLTIDPPISGTFKWQGRTLVFTPDRREAWQPDRTYRITVKYRDQVLSPSWTFTTRSFAKLISPGEYSQANWNDPIQIAFSEAMDHASVEAAFSTYPKMRGQFYWQDNTLTFKPQTDWDEGTRYVITLANSLKTADGDQPLGVPQLLYFTTVDESGEVSFGYGPKFQVVDPAGRRAVQFSAWGNLIRPATVRLYSIGLEQFLDRYTSGFRGVGPTEDQPIPVDDLKLLRTWKIATKPQEFFLPSDLTPGLYVLTLDHPASKTDELIILYTHHTLVLKQADGYIATWASQIDGGPLADMRIRIFSRDAKLIAEGQTDAQGLFVTQVPIDPQPLIVVGERDGEITASGLSNEWMQGGWYGWWEPRSKAQTTRAYIYTDRPIYRPGQTVHVKVISRYDNDAIYSRIPLEWDVIVRLRDARDNVIATKTLHVNEYGTLDTSFDLAEGGTLGEYHIETQIKDDVQRQAFKVEEYRKPEFEVTLQTDRSNIVNGDRVQLTVEAKTYFGAPLPNARLVLNRLTRTYAYWWYGADSSDTWNTLQAEEPLGITDADGRWSGWIDLKVPDYFFQEYYYSQHTMPVLLEVMASDGNGQAVGAQARVTVHDATLDLSGGLDRYMYKPGEAIIARAMTRDIEGKPRVNEPVTVKILKWSGQKYNQVVAQANAVSDQTGTVELTLTAPDQGWYRVEITGQAVTVIDWLWVYDSKYDAPWFYENSSGIQINADKDRYVSGETAQLLIRSPISGPALLSVERGRVRRAQVVQLTTPTTLVPLWIQDDDAPNIYVTINAYQSVEKPREETYMSIPDARLLVASTKLSVSADQRKLTVLVTPDRSSYGPREEATFTIQVTGADGKPAQAELSLALVDEAIYALSNELSKDPFEAFYGERSNLVHTFDSLKPTRYIGGGMGGGGGDGGLLGNPRFNFPDTAYWNAHIVTDEQGRAVVKVTLPDSLTRWRAVVRAVTADEFPRVGEAVAKITTTQPIVIRPVLPRQLVQGDRVLISAIVHNNTDRDRTAVVWADFNGTQMNTGYTDSITQTITISANNSAVVGWPIEVQTLGTLTVTLRVKSDKAADAVRLSVPIGPLAVPEVEAIIGNTTSSAEHTIELPTNTIKEISTLQIDLSPSIAASILDGLAYLTGYPFGCVEQTMSKALPNAVVGRAFTALGVDNPQIKADLPSKVNAGLQRLYGYQHNDGGWGWWFDDSTDDYQTAYVLFGLAMTKQAGYEVDQGVIDRGAKYMTERLPSINDDRTKAYALFALAMNGKGQLAETRHMATITDTQRLDVFSQAGLAIALHELGDEVLAQKMIDHLIEQAVVTDSEAYWNTGDTDGHYHEKTMSSSMRSTALALDAIVRIRPDDPIVPKIVRWLMAHRAPDGWGTTQETSYTVVALTDYLRASGELNSGSTYRVYVNDQLVQQGTLSGKQIQQTIRIPATQLRDGANRVRLERDRSGGQLYYKITQRALIAGSTDRAAGPIEVTRTYRDPKSNKVITNVQPGDVIKVEVKVTMPDDGWYVAIEDPLPGGLEGVNERLNTTSFTARQGYYEEGDEFFYQDYGYNNKEIHDGRVVFFVTHLGKGAHTFTYLARAAQAGVFSAMPAQVYLMYAPEQWGRSSSGTIAVSEVGAKNTGVPAAQIVRAEKMLER
jgi:uncharacterized protein YfaS (alpha-2-macroglobulin family)